MSRSDRDLGLVRDILGCIEAIDRAEATVTRQAGDLDVARVALDAVRFQAFTIGEAVKALSPDLREDRPAVAWSDLENLKDLIGHRVEKLDPQMIRATLGTPVKRLRSVCRAILAESARTGEDEP